MKLPIFIKNHGFGLLLALVCAIVILANWVPGTFLSGWDTLHPEFNFPLAFERVFFGVWRTDQGLGTVAIQSHMAEIPRLIILWILSHVLSLQALRYATMLTPLLIGPLGVYILIRSLFEQHFRWRNPLAFLGALAYLANLGTVQQFVVPLEMFAIHYGLLPWVLYIALQFLEHGKRRMLLWFFIAIIGLIPQAHTATLFYAFFSGFFLIITGAILIERKRHMVIRAVVLFVTVIFLNGFWLFPNVYAVITQGKEVKESKINRLFSPEAFAKNQRFGTPQNAAIVKNFLFDWQLYSFPQQKMVDVVGPWIEHLKNPVVTGFGYGVFLVSLLGAVTVIKKKHKHGLLLLPITILAYLMLLNGTWPMTLFFDLLGTISSTLKEALRFPFTKFSIIYMIGLSVYFAFGVSTILSFLKKIPWLAGGILLTIAIGFGYYFLPAFNGNLVSPAMRIAIPNEYFEMFSWFNQQPKTDRVALLPIHTFWAWIYYDWGYQGAGLLQFGIPQPILDRDYDRWSRENEQYEREMQYAIYSQKPDTFVTVLQKYHARWIVLDTSVANIGGNQNATLEWLLPHILSQSPKIKKIKTFGTHISIYEYTDALPSLVETVTNIPQAGPPLIGGPQDSIFSSIGTYASDEWTDFDSQSYAFSYDERYTIPAQGNEIANISAQSQLSEPDYCGGPNVTAKRTTDTGAIRYESYNGSICDHFLFPQLDHTKAYVIEITSRNIQGFPLQVYICNDLSQHCGEVEYVHTGSAFKTESFYIPKYYDFGSGHTININNFSIRARTSMNEIQRIVITEAAEVPFIPTQAPGQKGNMGTILFSVPGITAVSMPLSEQTQQTIVYYERYHSGWEAYQVGCQLSVVGCRFEYMFPFLFGKTLSGHVLVNSWANGWNLEPTTDNPQPTTYIFYFFPQVLEWIGFALASLPFIFFLQKEW